MLNHSWVVANFIGLFASAQIESPNIRWLNLESYGLFQSITSFSNNPAFLASMANSGIGIAAEKKFLIEDLRSFVACAAYSMEASGFGMQVGQSGNLHLKETELHFSYGKKVGVLLLGLQAGIHDFKIQGYGKQQSLKAGVGVLHRIKEKISVGLSIRKIFNHPSNKQFALAGGVGCQLSAELLLAAEIEKNGHHAPSLLLAMIYQANEYFTIAAGLNPIMSSPHTTISFNFSQYRLSVYGSYHPQLGFSPGVAILFNRNLRKEQSPSP